MSIVQIDKLSRSLTNVAETIFYTKNNWHNAANAIEKQSCYAVHGQLYPFQQRW